MEVSTNYLLNQILRISKFFLLGTAIVFSAACTKTEITEVHEPYLIEGNDPPDYSGVTTLQVQNYVSRLYIDLLGEQPPVEVLQEKVDFLQDNELSVESRETLITELMEDEEYTVNIFNYTSVQFLNGVSRAELQDQINLYAYAIELYYDQGKVQFAQVLELEMYKMQLLVEADSSLQAGSITVNEFYRRFCYNSIFDEINMGSTNMVIACFENLFGRYPTNNELIAGVSMVDGLSVVILQETGNSKADFVEIVTHTDEFYLGRVYEQYQRLLTRQPIPVEEQEGAELLESEGFQAFQKSILISDEYAAF